jgi:uncharacterized protein YegL
MIDCALTNQYHPTEIKQCMNIFINELSNEPFWWEIGYVSIIGYEENRGQLIPLVTFTNIIKDFENVYLPTLHAERLIDGFECFLQCVQREY